MHIKCNVFKTLFYSFNPNMYSVLGFQKAGCVFGFVMFFTLLIVGIQGAVLGIDLKTTLSDELGVGSVEEMLDKYVPDFEIENGKLHMETPLDFEAGSAVVYVDDSVEKITMSDIDYLTQNTAFDMFIIGGQENIVLYRISDGRYSDIKFSSLASMIKTKADLIQLFSSGMKWCIAIFAVLYYIVTAIGHFLSAFVFMILLFILNIFVRRNVKAGELYKIGVYANVPYSVMDLLFFCIPYMMPNTTNFVIPNEITIPVCLIVSIVIGAFALYAVHGEKLEEAARQKDPYYGYGVNPYAPTPLPTGPAGAGGNMAIQDSDFGGYATLVNARSTGTVKPAANFSSKINLKGVSVNKDELDLIDRYVQGNLKDMAIEQLQSLTGHSYGDCQEIIYNWYSYYR